MASPAASMASVSLDLLLPPGYAWASVASSLLRSSAVRSGAFRAFMSTEYSRMAWGKLTWCVSTVVGGQNRLERDRGGFLATIAKSIWMLLVCEREA